MDLDIIKVPVRTVVELILRNGDINSGNAESNIFDIAAPNTAAILGSKAHRKIQKSKFEGYKSEVYLNQEFEFEDYGFNISLGGRADGVFTDESGTVCIDEIKSSLTPFEFIDGENIIHWGQAMCYAYMYIIKNNTEPVEIENNENSETGENSEDNKDNEDSENSEEETGKKKKKRKAKKLPEKTEPPEKIYKINAQITYYQLETEEMKVYKKSFDFDGLEIFVKDLVSKYSLWIKMERDWRIIRNASIDKLTFPFEKYRPGQRELAAGAYRTIIAEKKLFVNAPTGIGKTISTIFPAIKSMAHSNSDKIFYLTAKTVTRTVAYDAIYKMQVQGLQFKTVTVTAKDKICFLCNRGEARICNPERCEYAKGHYDRVNGAISETFKNANAITREVIEQYAVKHTVCPYELSLDLSVYSDAVICDYNYVFDPVVYLRRFFQNNFDKNYVFLIDEAHNLIDRAREIYSAEIVKSKFSSLKKSKIIGRQHKFLKKAIADINKYMIEYKKRCLGENGEEPGETNHKKYIVLKEHDKDFGDLLWTFRIEVERYFSENKDIAAAAPPEIQEQYLELLQTYFNVIMYQVILNFYDERYVTYISAENSDLTVKLFCLDPSFLIGEALKRAKSSIIFSATLSPLSYYKEVLSGDEEDKEQSLPSPFDKNNLCLIIGANINTKYKEREKSYDQVAEYINITVQKGGNYIAFFPSYEYMKNVYEIFCEKYPETPSIIQTIGMKEEERDIFLENFQGRGAHCASDEKNKCLVGFCVMGGIFSEGIDLTGDRLNGAIIVGVGLPKLSSERDIIKRYFETKNNLGYEYSYMYPGMNKVLQAAGRVIRTENDRGIVLLLDERFNYNYYRQLFPGHWNHYRVIRNPAQLRKIISGF
ncbi:MAG: ATP-dependent DNA helicase [Oscillospiraceae bacterium]|nr:ATP-dependent DNA helicase [Oscillospiraceae bacterium]